MEETTAQGSATMRVRYENATSDLLRKVRSGASDTTARLLDEAGTDTTDLSDLKRKCARIAAVAAAKADMELRTR